MATERGNRRFLTAALWNMRWPAAIICGPVLGLMMVNTFFGLPGRLWFVAAGYFCLTIVLFTILVRGEARRLRRLDDRRH